MFAARFILTETGAAFVKPGSALGELLFFKSEHEKTDAEAVQDWESEGGASTRLHEEAFAEASTQLTSNRERANEISCMKVQRPPGSEHRFPLVRRGKDTADQIRCRKAASTLR